MTYQDAYAKCCSLGMQPLTIETDAEFECLKTLNISKKYFINLYKTKTISFELFADDMKLYQAFHTSGSSKGCYYNRYEFCPDTGIFVLPNDTRWYIVTFQLK